MLRQNYLKLSLIILGIAVLISFLIIHSSSHSSPKIAIDNPKPITNSAAQAFSLEQNNQKLMADVKNLEIKDDENITLKVSQELSQKILEMNADNDLSSGQLQVPNEELFSDEFFQKYKVNFWKNLKLTTINELKIGEENPPLSSLQYFMNVMQIIYDNKLTEDIYQENLQAFIDNEDADFIKDIINKLDKGISDLKNLVIPPSYTNIHLDLINFMNMKKAILFDLYNYSNDPLRALAAIQFLEEIDTYYQNWMINLTKKMENDGALNYLKF